MNRLVSPGIFALALTLVGGIWLVMSPFAMQTQPAGGAWLSSTIVAIAAGGVLVVVSLLGTVISIALGLRSLVSAAREAGAVDSEMASR
ncbi:MAG TPA: hypothetical protein VF770_07815 [Solirubrobacterales bacterium]